MQKHTHQEMQKMHEKGKKRKAAGEKECISQRTKIAKGKRKLQKKENTTQNNNLKKQNESKQNAPQKCACTTKFHTPPFFVCFFCDVCAFCVRYVCEFWGDVCAVYLRCYSGVFCVPKKTPQKCKKKHKQRKTNSQSKGKQKAK